MNKKELIVNVASKAGITQKEAEKALNAFMNTVEDTLSKGEKVQINEFGTFESRYRAEKKGVNPRTKEPITIAERKVPVLKFSKKLKLG